MKSIISSIKLKKFCREIGKIIEITKPPPIEEMHTFWENIWSKTKEYNPNAEWMKRERMKDKPA